MGVYTDRADTLPTSISTIAAAVAGGPAGLGVEADVGLAVHDEGEDAVAAAELAEVAHFLVHVARAGGARGGGRKRMKAEG